VKRRIDDTCNIGVSFKRTRKRERTNMTAREFRSGSFAAQVDRRTFLVRSSQAACAAVLVPQAMRGARAAESPVVETAAG